LNKTFNDLKNSSFWISAAGLGGVAGCFLKKNKIGAVTTIYNYFFKKIFLKLIKYI